MDKVTDDQLDNSNLQEQPPQQQQQQQQQQHDLKNEQSSSLTTSTSATTTTSSSSSSSTITSTLTSTAQSMLFSTKKWGTTPIRQDIPWELPPSPTQQSSTLNSTSSSSSAAAAAASAASSATTNNNNNNNNNINNSNNNNINNSNSTSAIIGAGGVAPGSGSNLTSANVSIIGSVAGSNVIFGGGGGSNNSSGINSVTNSIQQQPGEFARAPGSATSILNNNMAPKPFGVANRSSTWSAFGTPAPNESEPEWPKATNTSGISTGNSTQPTNAFDLVPDYESGKSWHGSMLMKGLTDDDSSLHSGPGAGIAAFAASAGAYVNAKSPTGSQYEPSGIGTWSPIVKGCRPGSKWDGDGPDNGRGDNGRFDDGTAIWGSPAQSKVAGLDWVEKTGDLNSNNDKSRSMAGNNQSYRHQQSSSSTSLLMSSNTSPSSQHSRNQQTLKQPSSSHNFDQVQQQSNALSSQVNQPNRALGLSSNVPSTQQLKHMVQQIQLAVQAGHLNPQILNQPLAPVTLQLLYQLLQQIKILQQLQMQVSQQFNKPGNHLNAVNQHINKTKQNILNFQNQIAAQQAVYLKQTQGPNISSRQPTMPSLATGGVGGGMGPALPPGISQSGDSFRSGTSISDFHAPPAMVNNFGVDSMSANGLANSLGPMNLAGVLNSRFDQQWRAPAAKQQQQQQQQHQSSMATSSPFGNHNLITQVPSSIHKSMLNSGASGNGGSSFIGGMQQNDGFARAPGQATSMMDNMAPKPFGMANRSSTWSAFGSSAPSEPESEWPKTTSSGISGGNSTQPSNAFDLVPEFEPGKPWRGSMLMKSVEDDPTMTPGSMARSLAPQRKTIWSDEI